MEPDQEHTRLFDDFPPVSSAEWESQIIKDLQGADYDKKLIWKTYEGLNFKPFYRQEDLEPIPFTCSLPGLPPFVRGNRESGNHWQIRQDIESREPRAASAEALKAIKGGANAIGLDVSLVRDFDELVILMDGIDLSKTAVHFEGINDPPEFAAWLGRLPAERDFAADQLHGSFNTDPLGHLMTHGNFQTSEKEDFYRLAETLSLTARILPSFRSCCINGRYLHDAGASVIQEMAFTLSMGCEYLAVLSGLGLEPGNVCRAMQFNMATGSGFFLEIAKIRAMRLLWPVITSQYGVSDGKMIIHSTSSRWNKTLYDPYVNVLRTTTEAMSAAIAGSDVISIAPYDSLFCAPNEFSSRLARNQQVILKEESWLDKVADPAGGSYYVEKLTDMLAREAWNLFRATEERGGFLAALKKGFIQEQVTSISSIKQSDLATRRLVLIGTNQYPATSEQIPVKEIQKQQYSGEKPVTEVIPLNIGRAAEPFEALRQATEAYTSVNGAIPEVLLFAYGNLAMRQARMVFASNFFGCAGYRITTHICSTTPEDGLEHCSRSESDIIVFCGSDEEYPGFVPLICRGLKAVDHKALLVLAGYPKENLAMYEEAGISEFIHIKSNLLQTLLHFHRRLGII